MKKQSCVMNALTQIAVKCFTLLLLFGSIASYSQDIANNKPTIVSPEASAIALYNQYPVDYVSGVPNIEIPLFEINTKMGVIPFKLSYHIGKIKPAEFSGIVGFGWSLSPNIGITRSVNGAVDGVNRGFPDNYVLNHGGTVNTPYKKSASKDILDEKPDDFFYSLIGKSGQFLYNNAGSFSTIPYEPIKIAHTTDDVFTIVDDNGSVYSFGNNNIERVGTNYLPSDRVNWKVNSILSHDNTDNVYFEYSNDKIKKNQFVYYENWFIEEYPVPRAIQMPPKIYAPSYDIDTIGYRPAYPIYTFFGSLNRDNLDVSLDCWNLNYDSTVRNVLLTLDKDPGISGLYFGNKRQAGNSSLQTTEQVLLTGIRTNKYNIRFEYQSDRLNAIKVFDKSGNLIKKVGLYQSILGSTLSGPIKALDNQNQRYKLDSVHVEGGSASDYYSYKMTYSAGDISSVCSGYCTDFWGFQDWYRGGAASLPFYVKNYKIPVEVVSNTGTPPSPYSGGLITENVNILFGMAGLGNTTSYPMPPLLKSVQYPTGGKAVFSFEPNRHRSFGGGESVSDGGGYRIKEIEYIDPQVLGSIKKVYKYGMGENGVGNTKYGLCVYGFVSQQEVNIPENFEIPKIKTTTISPNPHIGMTFSSGAPILYPEVTEYTIPGNSTLPSGKTVYRYTLSSANYSTVIPMTPLYADYRDSWRDYSLECVTQYALRDGNYTPVSKTSYQYEIIPKGNINAAATYQTVFYPDSLNIEYNEFARLTYSIPTGVQKISKVTDSIFADNGSVLAKSSYYQYDPYSIYKIRDSSIDSKKQNLITEYSFVTNTGKVANLPSAQSSIFSSWANDNRLSDVVEIRKYNGADLSGKERVEYDYQYPRKTYRSVLNNPLKETVAFNQYDERGNVVEVQKSGDVKEVYLWGYARQYPVARIAGSDYTTIHSIIDQAMLDSAHLYTDAQLKTELQKLRDYNYGKTVLVSTYTYKPLVGMTSETDPSGKTIYYKYDVLGRLSLIENENHQVIKKIAYAYNAMLGNIFWNDAQSQTVTKNDCNAGASGNSVTYTVPANRYSSSISKQKANELALQDIAENGQAYANRNGSCTEPPPITLNGNNYVGEVGWRVSLTNTVTNQVYDFEVPQTVRGPIGSIKKGTYNIRIYNVNGNAQPNYFEVGGTTTMSMNGLEGIFNNVSLLHSAGYNDHIDIFW